MAVDALRVAVLFSAIDKLTGPVKGMRAGSKGLKADLVATRKEILSLERAQGKIGSFKAAEQKYSQTAKDMAIARNRAEALRKELDKLGLKDRQLAKEAAAAGNFGKGYAKTAKELEKLEAAEKKAAQAHELQGRKVQDLGRKLEAAGVDLTDLGRSEDRLANKVYDANKRLADQETKLKAIERAAARAEKVKRVGDKMASAGMKMSLGITLPAIALGKASFDAAGDAIELESAYEQTFGKLAPMMKRWAVETGNAMGRSTQEMEKGANTFGIFFNQVAKGGEAANMSKKFAVLAQDLGSFFNTDTETAIQKLRSGLSGEAEPLRDFGVFLNEAAVKAKLLQMGIKPVGKNFTDQQKILARYNLILEATTKAQGDVARTADSPANRLRRSKAAFQELQVTIGQKLIPALVPLISQVTALLEAFNGLSPETQGFIVKALAIAAVLGPVLVVVGKVVGAIGAMRKAYLAFKAAQAGGAILGGLSMGPLLIIVAVAAAIGVAAYLIWKHWDKIKAAFSTGVAAVSAAWSRVKGAAGAALAWLAGLPGRFATIGAQLIQGLINGVTGKLAALKNTIVNAARSAANWFKSKLGIRSPSRVFMEFGGHITGGLARGIAAGEGAAARSVASLSSRVAGAFAAGALVASPAAASTSAGAGRPVGAAGGLTIGSVTIQIVQQPGENGADLARQIQAELQRLAATSSRSSYHDDD
jgi:hypothetical protein